MSNGYNYIGKRYIALVRASDASDGTTSTEAQLAMLHDRAATLKMVHVDDVVLNNVTGSMPGKRTDMDELIARKKQSDDYDVLVVQRLDRLTRGGSDHGFWFQHELKRAGVHLLVVGDDIPDGRYASMIKAAKYDSAQDQAFSISQRSTQGYQLALEEGRVTTASHTPYACWRLYLSADNKPLHIIRDLGDGRQQKLDPTTHTVIDTYGQIGGGGKGHYRKQKQEKVLLIPGDPNEIAVIRDIFDLHFRQGWGGKRIADRLNRQSIPSPDGKSWSQRQVDVLYNNEVYTGRSVGNRVSSGIYHSRNHATPKQTNLDSVVLANAKTIPAKLRPKEEWFVVEQPHLKNLLGDDKLRALAVHGQDRYWQHAADPDRPKRNNNKHRTSDYLLSGLLFAKQDNGPLVGILCGRVGKKVRYYRHRRSQRGYIRGGVFSRMIHAETVEKAVLGAVQDILLDPDHLKARLTAIIETESRETISVDLDALKRQRDKLKKRTEFLVANLDEETLADAQPELTRLRAERRRLDEQIAAAERPQLPKADPSVMADDMVKKTKNFFGDLSSMSNHRIRDFLGAAVSKVVVDMETKAIEISVQLPSNLLKTAFLGQKAMRLITSSESSSSDETHPAIASIAIIDCRFQKAANQICFDCRRRAA